VADYKWFFRRPKKYNPKDALQYLVTKHVIDYTINILREYGTREHAAEGLIYWAGAVNGDVFNITAAIAPQTDSSRHGIKTSNESNAMFVEYVCDQGLEYIAQVHSHPGTWVDHSGVDNEETAFRSEGLVSIVVPSFGADGMTPLTKCGIHRYSNGKFIRLNDSYIKKHFCLTTSQINNSLFKDLRNE
jgi:proteasome lid subunit RPN8/RPN11